jgi:hypothetical protein
MRKDFVVVGSQAMKAHFPDFPRIPKDTDIVCSRATFLQVIKDDSDIEWKTVDEKAVHMADSVVVKYTTLPSTFEYLFSDGSKSLELILDSLCDETNYAPVQVLYSLKKAHIHFPIKFHKHIGDFMFLRQKLREKRGISLERDLGSFDDLLDGFPALTYLHFQDTEARRGKLRTPKMAQDTKQFFGKSKKYVTSYFVHDDMHKAIAEMLHKDNPVYLKILKEGAEVETDPQLWSSLTVQEKIWCVLEEVYVIALERKIVPPMFELKHYSTIIENEKLTRDYKIMTPKEAFDWALFRVCTTLCDGFFREFAVRAYDEIQKQYDPDYVTKFFNLISKYDRTIEEDTEN